MKRWCCLLLLAGCSDAPQASPEAANTAQTPWFTDHTAASGVTFSWRSGATGRYAMPEIIGGGGALFDADDDGDLDLYLPQGGVITETAIEGTPDTLWRNDGAGRFTRAPLPAGASGYGMGVTAGDADNDGDVDLYVLNLGANRLLLNDGTGVFTDATEASGTGDDGWGATASFFDADGDGDLDLFLVNYLAWSLDRALDCADATGAPDYCSPNNFMAPTVDRLYRNDGDGTFTDVTQAAGLNARPGTGLGIAAADFDGDRDQDVFVANDLMADHLWLNNGDGTFTESALHWGCAMDDEGKAKAGMGVDATDIDDDGDIDLIVCNLKNESDSFFRNDGAFFTDITTQAGLRAVTRANTRFGLGFVDFDNDGQLDLYEANGAVLRPAHLPEGDPYAQRNLALRGLPDGRFEPTFWRGGMVGHIARTSRGAVFGDIDTDGHVDVVVINRDAPAVVLHNTPGPANWAMFDVRTAAGAPALGALVQAKVGDRRVTRPVKTAWSYMCANDPRVHLGLGDATAVDAVTVTWPDGTVRAFSGPFAAGQVHRLTPTAP